MKAHPIHGAMNGMLPAVNQPEQEGHNQESSHPQRLVAAS
jgi:hypothetical protein